MSILRLGSCTRTYYYITAKMQFGAHLRRSARHFALGARGRNGLPTANDCKFVLNRRKTTKSKCPFELVFVWVFPRNVKLEAPRAHGSMNLNDDGNMMCVSLGSAHSFYSACIQLFWRTIFLPVEPERNEPRNAERKNTKIRLKLMNIIAHVERWGWMMWDGCMETLLLQMQICAE